MVDQGEADTLFAVLTEASWLRDAGEPEAKVEWWVRVSLRQRLARLPMTTGRALLPSST